MATNALPVINGVVRVPDVAKAAGISYGAIRGAIDEGLIEPTTVRMRHNTRTLTVDDALLVMAIAGLATLTGLAFLTLLRAIRDARGTLGPHGITIPTPTTASTGMAA